MTFHSCWCVSQGIVARCNGKIIIIDTGSFDDSAAFPQWHVHDRYFTCVRWCALSIVDTLHLDAHPCRRLWQWTTMDRKGGGECLIPRSAGVVGYRWARGRGGFPGLLVLKLLRTMVIYFNLLSRWRLFFARRWVFLTLGSTLLRRIILQQSNINIATTIYHEATDLKVRICDIMSNLEISSNRSNVPPAQLTWLLAPSHPLRMSSEECWPPATFLEAALSHLLHYSWPFLMLLLRIGDELVLHCTLCGQLETRALLSGTVPTPSSGWSVPFLQSEKRQYGVRWKRNDAGWTNLDSLLLELL